MPRPFNGGLASEICEREIAMSEIRTSSRLTNPDIGGFSFEKRFAFRVSRSAFRVSPVLYATSTWSSGHLSESGNDLVSTFRSIWKQRIEPLPAFWVVGRACDEAEGCAPDAFEVGEPCEIHDILIA